MVNLVEAGMVGLATNPKALDQLCKDTRAMLRLIGPRVSATQDERFAQCNLCNPPPPVYECVICHMATEHKWVYKMHIQSTSGPCFRTMQKRAYQFSRKV